MFPFNSRSSLTYVSELPFTVMLEVPPVLSEVLIFSHHILLPEPPFPALSVPFSTTISPLVARSVSPATLAVAAGFTLKPPAEPAKALPFRLNDALDATDIPLFPTIAYLKNESRLSFFESVILTSLSGIPRVISNVIYE